MKLACTAGCVFLLACAATGWGQGFAAQTELDMPTDGDPAAEPAEPTTSVNVQAIPAEGNNAAENAMSMALAALKNGDLAAAQMKVDQVLKENPKNATALVLAGRIKMAEGNFPEASDLMLKGIESDPKADRRALNNLGKDDQATRNLDAARTAYGANTWAQYMKVYLRFFPPKKGE